MTLISGSAEGTAKGMVRSGGDDWDRTFWDAGLGRVDRDLFEWLSRRHDPLLDAVLPRLSLAADHGVLWMGVAGLLIASGRPAWRRAGIRGITSVAVASALTNGIAKLSFRRRRPLIDGVPLARRVRRAPVTTSFPSGHAASAAAFTVAASRGLPWLSLPLTLLAAGVGFSRVWTGAHYPSDVLAGAGLGGLIGLVLPERLSTSHPMPIQPRGGRRGG
jgi:membrane-associated phospholipid phosphatase